MAEDQTKDACIQRLANSDRISLDHKSALSGSLRGSALGLARRGKGVVVPAVVDGRVEHVLQNGATDRDSGRATARASLQLSGTPRKV